MSQAFIENEESVRFELPPDYQETEEFKQALTALITKLLNEKVTSHNNFSLTVLGLQKPPVKLADFAVSLNSIKVKGVYLVAFITGYESLTKETQVPMDKVTFAIAGHYGYAGYLDLYLKWNEKGFWYSELTKG